MDLLFVIGVFFAGLGVFFAGCGLLWWCSMYQKMHFSKEHKRTASKDQPVAP